MSIIDELRRDANGAAIIDDWIGEGLPVTQAKADARAVACLRGDEGGECLYHVAPKWWETFSKLPVSRAIKHQLEVKNKMELKTELDSHQKMCGVCGCNAALKAWVPIHHVKAHSSPELIAKYPKWCWQRKEMQ